MNNKELVLMAGGGGTPGTDSNAVHYSADSNKTDAEKLAARQNMNAASAPYVVNFTKSGGDWAADKTFNEVAAAHTAGKDVRFAVSGVLSSPVEYENDGGTNVYRAVIAGSYSTPKMYNVFMTDSVFAAITVTEIVMQKTPTKNTVSGATPTISPVANNIYNCGELTSLTVSNPPATGEYTIVFTSGSTATTTTIPNTILGLESFSAEANTLYEINVLDNRAVVGSWEVSSS